MAPRRRCWSEAIVFLLQTHAIGHVLMGRNPAAIRCRLVGGIERAAIACREGPLQRSAGRDPFHDLVVVLLDIKAQKPGVLAKLKKRTQRAAWFRYAGGQVVHA
jgi:hypothetical protein